MKIINFKDSLTKVYTPSDLLAVKVRSKDSGSDGYEAEHEVAVKKDLKITDFKDLLAKTYTYPDFLVDRDRYNEGGN